MNSCWKDFFSLVPSIQGISYFKNLCCMFYLGCCQRYKLLNWLILCGSVTAYLERNPRCLTMHFTLLLWCVSCKLWSVFFSNSIFGGSAMCGVFMCAPWFINCCYTLKASVKAWSWSAISVYQGGHVYSLDVSSACLNRKCLAISQWFWVMSGEHCSVLLLAFLIRDSTNDSFNRRQDIVLLFSIVALS